MLPSMFKLMNIYEVTYSPFHCPSRRFKRCSTSGTLGQ